MENNKEMLNYLLICLGEECAEVQKAIAKYPEIWQREVL